MRIKRIGIPFLVMFALMVCLFTSAPTIYLPIVSAPKPSPTGEPLPPVYVDSDYSVIERADGLKITGEVVNNSPSAIHSILIKAEFLNDQTGWKDYVYDSPTIQAIGPGESTCFDFFYPYPDVYFRFFFDPPAYSSGINRPDLMAYAVEDSFVYTAENTYAYTVSGLIQNINSRDVQSVQAAITVYQGGKVFDCIDEDDASYIDDEIEPWGIREFRFMTNHTDKEALPEDLFPQKVQVMSHFQ